MYTTLNTNPESKRVPWTTTREGKLVMKLLSSTTMAVALALLTSAANAQTADTGTIQKVHFGVENNCFAFTLSSGGEYAASFDKSISPNFTPTQAVAISANVDKFAKVIPTTQVVTCDNGQQLYSFRALDIFSAAILTTVEK